ncbi:MAG: AAA family ATPase, partial [Chloroflexi bacterium]|nr:AAA family ATPase [Chloroflexota bacterium]
RYRQTQEDLEGEEPLPEQQLSLKPVSIYAYGVARNRLEQSAGRLGVPAKMVRDLNQADVMVTLKAYYRKRQRPIMEAEERGVPIYVLRSNTINQIDQALVDLFNLSAAPNRKVDLNEVGEQVQSAINSVLSGQRWVDLPPAPARVRRLQHELVREAELISHSYGKEPNRRVRIFRE